MASQGPGSMFQYKKQNTPQIKRDNHNIFYPRRGKRFRGSQIALRRALGGVVPCDTREGEIVSLALGISGHHYYASQLPQKFSDYVRVGRGVMIGWVG